MALEELLAAASEVLGQPATLVEDLSFSRRALVARVAAGDGTVVVKRPFEQSAFENELEALRVLPVETRPALIGSADGVVVMEDLGTGPSLADLLLLPNRRRAEQGLHSWATTLGRALRATLRSGAPAAMVDLGAGLGELIGLATDFGLPVPAGIEDDVAHIEQVLSATSPWLAYCPGDTCPDNNRVFADGSVRLFDFEGSGWRHAATEAAYCRAPFCTCWCVAAMPPGLTASMERAFIDALDPPQRTDFRSIVGLAEASWTLTTFDYFRRFVRDGGPVGPPGRALSSGRQHVLLRMGALEPQRDEIPALAALAERLLHEILRRWPEEADLPKYPAFR